MPDQSNVQAAQMAHSRLVANAWQDPKVMEDLTSGDQARVKKQLVAAGLDVPKGVAVHVHAAGDKDVHLVIPAAPKADIRHLAGGGGGGHKCYGPFCICGPY